MIRTTALACCAMLCGAGAALGQQQGKVFGSAKVTEPWEAFVFTEPVVNSDIPVDITLVETVDGLFTPIGIRRPKGRGPFPIVLFFTGNGGAGVQQVRDYVNNRAYTMERFLAEGYAVAWLNYRAEAWFAYTGTPLGVGRQQANQLMSRPPLEYDDLRTIVDYVKRLAVHRRQQSGTGGQQSRRRDDSQGGGRGPGRGGAASRQEGSYGAHPPHQDPDLLHEPGSRRAAGSVRNRRRWISSRSTCGRRDGARTQSAPRALREGGANGGWRVKRNALHLHVEQVDAQHAVAQQRACPHQDLDDLRDLEAGDRRGRERRIAEVRLDPLAARPAAVQAGLEAPQSAPSPRGRQWASGSRHTARPLLSITTESYYDGYDKRVGLGGRIVTQALLEWATSRRYQVAWGPVAVLRAVRADLEARCAAGEIDPDFARNNLPSDFVRACTRGGDWRVLAVAVPRPAHLVSFNVGGETIDAILPPTYERYRPTFEDVREDLVAHALPGSRVELITAPLKLVAACLGLVRYGRNNVTYAPVIGSYLQLLAYLTDADLPIAPDWTHVELSLLDECATCRACQRLCPTGAITGERVLLQAERCLTLANESHGDWPSWVPASAHHCLLGCLQCQRLCPANPSLPIEESGVTFTKEQTAALLAGGDRHATSQTGILATLERLGLSDPETAVIGRNLRAMLQARPARRERRRAVRPGTPAPLGQDRAR